MNGYEGRHWAADPEPVQCNCGARLVAHLMRRMNYQEVNIHDPQCAILTDRRDRLHHGVGGTR